MSSEEVFNTASRFASLGLIGNYTIVTNDFYSGDASINVLNNGMVQFVLQNNGGDQLLSIRLRSATSYLSGQGFSYNRIKVNGVNYFVSPSYSTIEYVEYPFDIGLRHYVLNSTAEEFVITLESSIGGTVNYEPIFRIDSITISKYDEATSSPILTLDDSSEIFVSVVDLPGMTMRDKAGNIVTSKSLDGSTVTSTPLGG